MVAAASAGMGLPTRRMRRCNVVFTSLGMRTCVLLAMLHSTVCVAYHFAPHQISSFSSGKSTQHGKQLPQARGGGGDADPSSDAAVTCAEQLMALFSGSKRASNLTAARAGELRSCIRPLVPYHEMTPELGNYGDAKRPRHLQERRKFSSAEDLTKANANYCNGKKDGDEDRERMERLVQWPPPEVLELAKRAMAFGGAPEAVLSELSSIKYPVWCCCLIFDFMLSDDVMESDV